MSKKSNEPGQADERTKVRHQRRVIKGPALRKVDVRAMRRYLTWLLDNNRKQHELINSAIELIDKSLG